MKTKTWFISRPGSDYLVEARVGAMNLREYAYLPPWLVEGVFGIRMMTGNKTPQERRCDLVHRTKRGEFKPDRKTRRKPAKRGNKR